MPTNFPDGIVISENGAESFEAVAKVGVGCKPKAVAKLRGTEEIRALVNWANKNLTAVVPVSSIGPHTRQSAMPLVDDAIIADLSGMTSVLNVDARDKMMVIEPGVSFGEIDDFLLPYGLRVYRPLKPRNGKSLIASYLDREPLINPNDHWDSSDPFGGTCLVLGNGDVSLTGTAAIDGTLEEQLSKGHRHMYPSGPTNIDLLRVTQGSQGSLAILTWASVYCERLPTFQKSIFASANNLDKVAALARDMLHRRNGSTLFIVDQVQLALLMSSTQEDFQKLSRYLPEWTLFITFSGGYHDPEGKVEWQFSALEECAEKHGVVLNESLESIAASEFEESLRRSEVGSFRDTPFGAHKELFFLQSFSALSRVTNSMVEFAKNSALSTHPIGTYIQPMAQGAHCHVEFTLPYSPSDQAVSTLNQLWGEAIEICADNGAFYSRPYAPWLAAAFDDKRGTELMISAAKHVLDPNGIMNPNRFPYAESQNKGNNNTRHEG